MKPLLIGFIFGIIGLALLTVGASPTIRAAGRGPSQGAHSPGVLLVGFHRGTTPSRQESALARYGLPSGKAMPRLDVVRVRVEPGHALAASALLRNDPDVAFVEPDFAASAQFTPDDPRWTEQWGMARIRADLAWNLVTDTRGLVIAFLDTGIRLDHPDLEPAIWTNPRETPDNGLDDDGNGYVDDVHGWHFFQDSTSGDNDVSDPHGHGTHISGIAAAIPNNGVSVAGVAWGARLMPVRVLDEYANGWYSDIAAGMVYAADNGARILNLSLGGPTPSETLWRAVDYASSRGCLVVAAAGNSGNPVLYPAAYGPVVAVGATDESDSVTSFSNRGPELDLVAPGTSIVSTWKLPYETFTRSGTSMAAAHVSGLAALVWAAAPGYNAAQVASLLTASAVDLGPAGHDAEYGYGRIDAYTAVRAIVGTETPSPTPTHTLTAVPSRTSTPTTTPAEPALTLTATASQTPDAYPGGTVTPTPTDPAGLPTWTPTGTPSPGHTPSPTPTGSLEPLPATLTPSPTRSATPGIYVYRFPVVFSSTR